MFDYINPFDSSKFRVTCKGYLLTSKRFVSFVVAVAEVESLKYDLHFNNLGIFNGVEIDLRDRWEQFTPNDHEEELLQEMILWCKKAAGKDLSSLVFYYERSYYNDWFMDISYPTF